MKKLLFICFFVLVGKSVLWAQNVQHAELLGRPTDHSIAVQLVFEQAAEVCVQYGLTSDDFSQQTVWQSFAAGEPAEFVVGNLNANTRYYYRICHRLPGATDVTTRPAGTFHTQRPPGSEFTFVVQADPHLDSQSDSMLYRRCLDNQLADEPDFMIDLGDIFMSDKMKNAQNQITHDTVIYRVKYMRRYYEQIVHSVPLFIALGNHEGEAGWQLNPSGQNVAIYDALERKKYFLNPAPDDFYTGDETNHPIVGIRENYYSWEWGDALFVVLDPYWYTSTKPDSLTGWRWTLGQTQYNWLKNTLENSTATFKFVFAHQLVGGDPDGRGGIEFAQRYEWGGKNLDGTDGWEANRPGWYKPIKDLLTENRVTTFFHGHDHFFGKQDLDCLVYQETPQPSHPNFQNANQADDYGYFQGQILPNAGHLRVTVNPEGVTTAYVRAYLPQNESPTRHNRDLSAVYYIGATNCYDSLTTSVPVLWNANYANELVYPNPFSDELTIQFSLATPERLSLTIYDANGTPVKQLLRNYPAPAGTFNVTWNGADDAGRKLPAGIYFYMIRGENGGESQGRVLMAK